MSSLLKVEDVTFAYGGQSIVSHLSLAVNCNEVVAIMGPSGCGKSTMLRLITGLEKPITGAVMFESKPVYDPPQGVFLGFQDFDTFPWLTVEGNVEMARRFRAPSYSEHSVASILEDVGLRGAERKYPKELSGGMRKRLAFARCLASGARLVLLDEPFASLDVKSRVEMQHLLHRVVDKTECGVIVVTHDAEEAVFLATRVDLCSGPPLKILHSLKIESPLPRSEEVIKGQEFEAAVLCIREHFRNTRG